MLPPQSGKQAPVFHCLENWRGLNLGRIFWYNNPILEERLPWDMAL